MPTIRTTARFAIIAFGGIFIGLSLLGIFGVWLVERRATDVALNGFGLVETAAAVINAGVTRMNGLIATSRTEVRQAAETISTVGSRAETTEPALGELSERLETKLAPRIAQMREALAPVRDAVATIGNVVSLVNSLPTMADRAPRLAVLDETFNRLEGLSSDAMQLRSALQALVTAQTSNLRDETIAKINGITQRVDTRLVEVQTNVQSVQADIAALQVRMNGRKSRLMFIFNLVAVLATLMLAWIIYSQVTLIRHHSTRLQPPAT